RRHAQNSADAAALAAVQGLAITGENVTLTAATYAFKNLNLTTPTGTNPCNGDASTTCYTTNGVTVEVTTPYARPPSNNTDSSLVHVRVCWNVATAFAQVISWNSIKVCGAPTAQNTGVAGAGGGSGGGAGAPGGDGSDLTPCAEDNFAISGGSIIPKPGTPVKQGTTIGAHFRGLDSNLNTATIVFQLRDPSGNLTTLPYDPSGANGYKLNPKPPANGIYNGNQGQKVDI